ncbi:MAG: hypothetical protein V4662_00685 [Verrucomicrobiota bacterium]
MKNKTKNTLLGLLALTLAATPQARAISNSFAGATVITDSNGNTGGEVNLMAFTVENGEPGHRQGGDNGAQKSAWWRWTAPTSGFCTVDTIEATDDLFIRDTLVSVYTGASVNALTRVASNDDHELSPTYGASNAASATFYAAQGTTYHIAVDGYTPSSINADNNKVRLRLRHMASVPENRIGNFGSDDEESIHGSIQLSKTAGHAFTAKLMLAGKAYPFNGVFSLDGYYIVSVERKVATGATPLPPLTLMLDGARGGRFNIVSSISGSTGALFCTVQRFTTIAPSSMKGLYTASVGGAGTLTLNVSNLGVTTGATTLSDGTKTTFGSSLCFGSDSANAYLPTYVSLHSNAGYFKSYLKITEAGAVDVLGAQATKYIRPAKVGAVFYPAGLEISPSIIGATYTPPMVGTRALGFLDAMMGAGKLNITMQGMEINPAITENLTLATTNLIKFTSPLQRKPALSLNKANGLVTGSIYDQVGKRRTMTGVLYRDGMTVKLKGQLSGTTFNPVFDVTVP